MGYKGGQTKREVVAKDERVTKKERQDRSYCVVLLEG